MQCPARLQEHAQVAYRDRARPTGPHRCLLVASDRGVTVLPDWVVSEIKNNSDYTVKPLKKTGVQRGLFAATRTECLEKPYMRNLIDLAGQEASRLQKD